MKNNKQIFKVEISKDKISELEKLIEEIDKQELSDVSFSKKQDYYKKLSELTNDVINERGQTFSEAGKFKSANPYHIVKIIVQAHVENLLDRSFVKQKEIMDSYYSNNIEIEKR